MGLHIFFVLFLTYGCLADNISEINSSILQKIDVLANEVQFLKGENCFFDKKVTDGNGENDKKDKTSGI